MSFARWSSLIAGGVAALLVSALLWYARSQAWPQGYDSPTVLIAALGVGLALSLVHWMLAANRQRHQRRLATYIETLARPEARGGAYAPDPRLEQLTQAVEGTVAALRKRNEHLAAQRRELEVQLRICEAERSHAEAILNSIADAVVVTDAFNEVVLANGAAARVLGFEQDRALRQPVERVITDPKLIKLIKDTREGGDTALRRHVEHCLGAKAHPAVYDVSLACISDHGPTPSTGAPAGRDASGVVTILRDITREKEIAEMKSDFVSNVSHELRTPLSSIKAYVEMLVDGEANDEQTRTEFYNIIQGETNRLQRLIDNILNISRIESGVVKVQREQISLPALIKDAIDVMQPQARAKNIRLAEVPMPVFFSVFADKDMVYQSTLNLIGNAIKYTKEGGQVSVSISVDEHSRTVSVSVTDTGVGIPPDDLPHVFDKFYRVADHKKMAKGTGLGLALVKQVIETVHGGKVSVASQVGKGSTFTFSLPMADNG